MISSSWFRQELMGWRVPVGICQGYVHIGLTYA